MARKKKRTTTAARDGSSKPSHMKLATHVRRTRTAGRDGSDFGSSAIPKIIEDVHPSPNIVVKRARRAAERVNDNETAGLIV